MKTNHNIKCDVESCKHNNCKENCCSLDEIKVSCTCNSDDATEKEVTICENFECDSCTKNDQDND